MFCFLKHHFEWLYAESESEVTQSCPAFCNPVDCSPSGPSVHGIPQARILEWVAISFSKGSSQPRNWTRTLALQADSIPTELQGKPLIPKKGNAKECSNCHTIVLISHASKVMLKILQARLQRYVNHELPDVQAGFRKRQRNQRSNCQHLLDHQENKRVQKNIYFCFIDYAKVLTVWITTHCGKFLKRWVYETNWPASCESCMHVKKQQLELDMEQQFQIGKGVCQGRILSPCLFNFYAEYIMQNGWSPSWSQDCWEKYQ